MIRYGKDSDFETAKKIWSECFTDSLEEVNFYFENLYDKHKYLVLEENDEIKASLHENPYQLNLNGTVFNSLYIVGVAVSPQYRGKGYMDKLLRETLLESRKREIPLIFLLPINSDIYRRYGFEYISSLDKILLDTKDIPYNKIERAYDIKRVEVENEELYIDLIKIYKRQMEGNFLYIERDENYYKNWLKEIVSDGGEVYALYLDDEIRGYIALYKGEKLVIREIFSEDRRGLENLLAFLKTFKEYYPQIEIKFPQGHLIEYCFKNQKKLEKRENLFIMGRVLNPMEILKMLNIYGINLKLLITDNIILENNGVYEFTSEGEINFKSKSDWDIKIDIGDFSSLIFGMLSLEELIFLEKLEIKERKILNYLKEKGIFTIKRNYIQDYQ